MLHRKPWIPQSLVIMIALCSIASLSIAQDRTLNPEQLTKLAGGDELQGDENAPPRPSRLPDLTKGDLVGEKIPQNSWHLGPTGIIGYMVGGLKGDQIQVESTLPGSPAAGKLQFGDVIVGINGKKFSTGGTMGIQFGNEIIEAEKEENGGMLKLHVWRDRNFVKRNGKRNIAALDIGKVLDDATADNSLFEWKSEEGRNAEVRQAGFDEFPLDPVMIELDLKLRVLPPYSDTSPYDCPKADRIREDAWKILVKEFQDGRIHAHRSGSNAAIALIASGKPEHRKIVHDWVRSNAARSWQPSFEGSIDMMKGGGYFSWRMGFTGLDAAVYYDATGDDFVLPAIREYAVKTAMGQAGGGSWGHTFAWPGFNGGKLHGMNPGYGALNAAGNRCFFLLALAKKLGIEHPEIDDAIERARRFFGSYVDKGGIPYGHHGAAATDDSNGKNVGCAFALKLLGDHHGAKYFAQMSTHASFTRRGGHGNDYFWHYSPWAATLCGREGTIVTHRNLRWRFTLCRRWDGGFVIHSPTGGIQSLRNPTATYAMHYSAPLKQTLFTGKDVDPSYAWTEKEMDHLMTSALPQLNDPMLIKRAGKPYPQRTTDELFKQLDMFKPKARGQYARELGKRYQAGETNILPRLAALLESDEPRLRDSACLGLAACGTDATLQYMSKVARLLDDPYEFVRMQATRTVSKASSGNDAQLALLNATVAKPGSHSMEVNSLRTITQKMFTDETTLARSPFEAGFDEDLVRTALEKLIELDPMGNRPFLATRKGVWSKDTFAQVAGPLVYVAEQEQIADQMFSGRRRAALGLLEHAGYREFVEAGASYLGRRNDVPRDIRVRVFFKRGEIDFDVATKYPALCRRYLDAMKLWLMDQPMAKISKRVGEDWVHANVEDLIKNFEDAKPASPMPSLGREAERLFASKLDAASGTSAKIKLCRDELKDLDRKTFFRKIAAMNALVDILGPDSVMDLTPYLGHWYWRLSDHARELVMDLPGSEVSTTLLSHFAKTQGENAAEILSVLSDRGHAAALPIARQALKHADAVVRAAAVQAVFKLGGSNELKQVFVFMHAFPDLVSLEGAEKALLSKRNDPSHVKETERLATWAVANWDGPVRRSLYFVLGQFGGEHNLAVLRKAAITEDNGEFQGVVRALSFSPDEQATAALLSIIKDNLKTRRVSAAISESIRRMVIGKDRIGNLPNKQRLDFAEAILNMTLNDSIISYMGRIKSGRCAYLLQRSLRQKASTATVQSIINATTDIPNPTPSDRKLGASALIDLIEFIEVNHLRGGGLKNDPKAYANWKALSIRAGKNLIKLDKPEEAPLPEFNDLDLDL